MKKRMISMLMALVMIITLLPTEVFAANGTNLGWEYADIEENRSSSGRLTGYDIEDPSARNYRGDKEDLSANVTVTYVNGSTSRVMTQGSELNNILSASSTGYVDITCSYGFYIAWIVLCCDDNGGFSCRTSGTEDAYGLATADSIPTHVRLNISDLYANANHDSNEETYFLMIQLNRIPTPAYVGYDAGMAGGTPINSKPVDTSTIVTDSGFQRWLHTSTVNPAMEYSQGATAYSTHTVLDITAAAEADANAIGAGYSFAGWQAEYYRYYDSTTNTFSNLLETGSGYDQPGDSVTLYTYVKMTAIWQPKENITVSKVWSDNNNQDGLRPGSVTVYLVSNGTTEVESAVLSDANGWTHTWTVPSKDVNGQDIAYSVSEQVPTGYNASYSGSETEGFTITNTHIPEKVDIYVNKVWSDSEDRDGIRPDSIKVHLLVGGEHYGTALTLNEANGWSGSWTGLAKFAGGVEITYVVAEENVDGYTPSYERDGYNVTITNTHNSELISMTIQKYWNDALDQDGIRPVSVTVQLLADGEAVGAPVVLNSSNNWYHTFTNLPKYEKGVEIQYTAAETNVPAGYTVSYNVNAATSTIEVTNTHVPETVEVSATKVWDDAGNQDGLRPSSVTVALYKDGIATGANAVLNAANGWSYTFTGLAKNSYGTAASYTVREISIPTGYDVDYSKAVDGEGNTACTITNIHVPEKADVTVTKIWDDAGNQDGKRPAAISVSLLADGTVIETVTLNAAGNWMYTFSDLDVYANGRKISYTVTEVVPEGYSSSIEGLVITNTYVPATADFSVVKVWDDNDNQDGKRPYAVVLTLYINGAATNKSVTVTAANNWSGIWQDLPLFQAGHAANYTVVESGYYATKADLDSGNLVAGLPEGYSVGHSYDRVNHIATITNSYEPENTFINVEKSWNDANDQDGIRPDSIVVILYKTVNGVKSEYDRLTLSDAEEWDGDFLHLPRYENGSLVSYTVEEVVPSGYTAQYVFDNALRLVTITNSHTPENINIPVRKVWDDNNNQDGKRNQSVTVRLYADGVATTHTLILSEANNWSGSFQNIAKYAQGHEVVYTLAEDDLKPGYTPSVTGSAAGGFVITNTYDPETTSVTVSKVWDDGNNQDNTRPASISVNLLADGKVVDTMEMNPGNLGIITFQNLPKYENGREIVYTVEEVVPPLYTASYSGNAANGFVITNSYTPKETSLTVSKVWDDNDNEAGIRPGSVVVHMTALNGQISETVTLSAANNWTYTWDDLDLYANGTLINYTVREENVAGYTVSYSRNGNHVTITNSHVIEKTSVTVQKVWRDQNNQDGKRPDSVQAALYANGRYVTTVTLSAQNNWKYTWSDLHKFSNGVEIRYTVREQGVPSGYTASTRVDELTGVIELINSYETATTHITVTKIWNDMDDLAGLRPDSVLVELFRNGQKTNRVVRLSKENNWTYTFENLNKYVNGTLALYHAMEVTEVPGYTVSYAVVSGNEVTITNTHIPELTSVSVTKVWDDNNNQDGIRPETIKVNLYADGEYVSTLELSMYNLGKITFENLLKSRDGKDIIYTVEEEVPDGYTASYSGSMEDGFVITNTHIPETVQFSVEKKWEDQDNQDRKRPDSVVVHLLANGDHTGQKVTLSEENGWKALWTDLTKFSGGTQIIYTVTEEPVEGYVASYSREGSHVVITNTYAPEKTELVVEKVWHDDDDRDGLRQAVEVELYANGQPTGKKATLRVEDGWIHVFTDLDKYADGELIVYTAVEPVVPDGYTVSYKLDELTGIYEIINTHVSETTQITVNKVWDDNNDQDGIRPDGIVVTLYADGISTGKNVVLDASNNWSHTFTNLYAYSYGTKVVYSVEEQAARGVDGYVGEVTDNGDGTITITNTHIPESIWISVDKKWDDNENDSGARADAVVIHLLANGGHTGDKVTLSAENGWNHVWSNLPRYSGGVEIVYTVMEEPVENYTAVYVREGNHVTITNSYAPEKTDLTVLKVWHDNNNQDGLRKEVEVELFANGEPTGRRAVLNAANNWKYEFMDLAKYLDGELVVYTAVELVVPDGYTVSYLLDEMTGIYEVINTHEIEKVDVSVNKIWEDQDDAKGLRPGQIIVELYANDAATGKLLTLSAESGWTGVFTDLDRNAAGTAIRYTVKEVDVPDGYEVLYTAQNGADGDVYVTINNAIVENPGTGDSTNITGFILLALLSMAGFITLTMIDRRKMNKA